MKKTCRVLLTVAALIVLPIFAPADEAATKAQIDSIARTILDRLPLGQRIVLKALSPDEAGLPEDFLRKLSSDLEASLLVASNFEINLTNRLTTEEIWREAIEFGDADFQQLYNSSQADVVLMLVPRATAAGVEISLTAYRLKGENAGQVIVSSGSTLLDLDMEQSLGVDVNLVADQISDVLNKIEEIRQLGGLIASPNSYAEYYHNARTLQQRGERDLALAQYESALAVGDKFQFVDPIMDLVDLASARYGKSHVRAYLENRIFTHLDADMKQFALLYAGLERVSGIVSEGDTMRLNEIFLPSLILWLNQTWRDINLEDELRKEITPNNSFYLRDYFLLEVARLLEKSLNEGVLQKYFIDGVRVRSFVDGQKLSAIESTLNRFEFALGRLEYTYGTGTRYALYSPDCTFELEAIADENWYSRIAEENFPNDDAARIKFVEDLKRVSARCANRNGQAISTGSDGNSFITNAALTQQMTPCTPPEGCWLPPQIEFSADRIKSFPEQEGISLGGYTNFGHPVTHSELSLEVMPGTDRLLFGDFFSDLARRLDNGTGLFGRVADDKNVQFSLLGGLMITDNVDISKPILVEMCDYRAELNSCIMSDISRDGTFISSRGAPLHSYTEGEGIVSFKYAPNGWFFAPAWIQSSITRRSIRQIEYTTVAGENKIITDGYIYADEEPFVGPNVEWTRIHPAYPNLGRYGRQYMDFEGRAVRSEFHVSGNALERSEEVTPSKAVLDGNSCWLSGRVLRVTNVDNYVNVRAQPGFDAPVVDEATLNSILVALDTSRVSYYGNSAIVDRCDAVCDFENSQGAPRGSFERELKMCFDENVMWYEVKTLNGSRGFVSGKFLEYR